MKNRKTDQKFKKSGNRRVYCCSIAFLNASLFLAGCQERTRAHTHTGGQDSLKNTLSRDVCGWCTAHSHTHTHCNTARHMNARLSLLQPTPSPPPIRHLHQIRPPHPHPLSLICSPSLQPPLARHCSCRSILQPHAPARILLSLPTTLRWPRC